MTVHLTSGLNSAAADTIKQQQSQDGETISAVKMKQPRAIAQENKAAAFAAAQSLPPPKTQTTVRENSQNTQAATGYGLSDAIAKLDADPDYQRLKANLDLLRQLDGPGGLAAIDLQFGGFFGLGRADGQIDWKNIEDAAHDMASPAREAANMLLGNPHLFHMIDSNSDGSITTAELKAAIARLKEEKTAMEDGVKMSNQPSSPPPKSNDAGSTASGASGNGGNGGTGATGSAGNTRNTGNTNSAGNTAGTAGTTAPDKANEQTSQSQLEAMKKKAAPPYEFNLTATDTQGKLDQTTRFLDDWQTKLQDEMFLAASKGDNATVTALQGQLARLQMAQQALQQMQQQLFTMMSNMMKMYGDMAMTAVNNSR
ncbi:MAG: hypothetical protein HY906_27785 [Deltaproteobacteria bacterium]|nr:hypothetical protein [Deltaproteobacteria bacterium]